MNGRGHLRREGRTWRLIVRRSGEPGAPKRWTSVRLGTVAELPTKTAARAAADRYVAQHFPGELHAGRSMDWQTWCDHYVGEHLVVKGRQTRSTQASIVDKHLRSAFTGPIHRIGRTEFQRFVTAQLNAGAAPATVRSRFSVLRRMFRAAADAGLAVTPPSVPAIALPKLERAQQAVRDKAFTDHQCSRILAAAPLRERTAFALARYIGLRAAEVLGLSWRHVDLDRGSIEVRQQAVAGELLVLKSRSSQAVLQAPPELLELLREYRQAWQPNPADLLFADETGMPETARELRERLHALLEQLGIPRRGLHGFRHALAVSMAAKGTNVEALRLAMRHGSLRTTAVYLAASSADVANALAQGATLQDTPS